MFSPITGEDFTVDHDLYVNAALAAVGVLECVEAKGDLVAVIEASPFSIDLLAGLVKPSPAPWTRAAAAAAAASAAAVQDPDGRAALFVMLLEGLSAYFPAREAIIADFPTVIMTGVTGRITEREPPETRGARQYGQWDAAVRTLAGYDPDITSRVLGWHLRDFLLAYEHYVQGQAVAEYRHQTNVYAAIAPYARKGTLKPPRLPRVLQGRRRRG